MLACLLFDRVLDWSAVGRQADISMGEWEGDGRGMYGVLVQRKVVPAAEQTFKVSCPCLQLISMAIIVRPELIHSSCLLRGVRQTGVKILQQLSEGLLNLCQC